MSSYFTGYKVPRKIIFWSWCWHGNHFRVLFGQCKITLLAKFDNKEFQNEAGVSFTRTSSGPACEGEER